MKRVYPQEEVCIGCRLCEVGCITEHSSAKDIIKAYKKERPRPLSRTQVEEKGALSLSIQCRHCEEPECVEACVTGAMHKEDSGVVRVKEEKCIGCWMCLMVCPFGVIKRDLAQKKSNKCDLCPQREVPACVEICPNRALVYEER